MQELLEAGVHFGHKVSRGHPRMKPYIYGARDGVHIIDLAKSEEGLRSAINFCYELGKSGGVLLVVGTKKQAKELIDEQAKEAGCYFITSHWVGGLLTNFDEIKKNFNKLNTLKKERESGELKRYTKKEQLLISRKLEKYDKELGGVSNMEKLPDALFIVDAVIENTAVKEALRMAIKLVGFSDTNANPTFFDYPIPANDDGIKSLKIIIDAIISSYAQGKKEAVLKTEELTKAPVAKTSAAKPVEPIGTLKVVDKEVAQETAVIEEEIEKVVVQESERKTE